MVPVGDSLSEHLDAAARMSDFTDEDVQRGLFALDTADAGYLVQRGHVDRDMVRTVLAAVLPAYAKRVRAEALREAAHAAGVRITAPFAGWEWASWLRARADAEDPS